MSSGQSKNLDLEDLIEVYLDHVRAGAAPSVEEFAAAHPRSANELRNLLPTLLAMEELAPTAESCDAAAHQSDVDQFNDKANLKQLGDYRIIREIGRGGMGVVYEAEQLSLARRVALKVLPSGGLDKKFAERFQREARAAAKLHHTNIVPVYDVGEQDGTLFYAMQYIRGAGLDDVVKELKRLQSRSISPKSTRADKDVPVQKTPHSYKTTADRLDHADNSADEAAASLDKTAITDAHIDAGLSAERLDSRAVGREETDLRLNNATSLVSGMHSNTSSNGGSFYRQIATIGVQVAEALDYAHRQGILHRDIKPANLLLDMTDTVWITDFGLARIDDTSNLTQTGDIIGTLRYMAPEAFHNEADRRSEVYALAVTLYELLVAKPAFDEANRFRLIHSVSNSRPQRLRSIDADIPADLETILEKAFDREPAARYATAGEFAADLERFVNDEPIRARKISLFERWMRWSRRNKPLAASLTAIALLLVALTIGSLLAVGMMDKTLSDLEVAQQQTIAKSEALQQESAEKDRERQRAERHLYAAQIALAENHLQAGDATNAVRVIQAAKKSVDTRNEIRSQLSAPDVGAREVLTALDAGQTPTDGLGWEWYYLDHWCDGPEWTIDPTADTPFVHAVAFSPDGRLLVSSAGGDVYATTAGVTSTTCQVLVRDFVTGDVLHKLEGHTDVVHCVAFRSDGEVLATAGRDGTIRLWNPNTGVHLDTIVCDPYLDKNCVHELKFSPDHRYILTVRKYIVSTVDNQGMLTVYSCADKQQFLQIEAKCGDFSLDGRHLFFVPNLSGGSRALHALDLNSRESVAAFRGPSGGPYVLTQSPGGNYIAAVAADNVQIWNVGNRKLIRTIPATDVQRMAFSPDESKLCLSGHSGLVRIVSVQSAGTNMKIPGTSPVKSTAFSQDSRWLAVGTSDGRIRFLATHREPHSIGFDTKLSQLSDLTFNEDATQIRAVEWHNNAELETWDGATGAIQLHHIIDATHRKQWPRRDYAFSSDARLVAAPRDGNDHLIAIWDVVSGEERVFPPSAVRASSNPDGDKTEAVADRVESVPAATSLGPHGGTVTVVAFTPDGRRLATGCAEDGQVVIRLWHPDSGELLRIEPTEFASVAAAAFSADGQWIALGGESASDTPAPFVSIRDLKTWNERQRLIANDAVEDLEFSPDGEKLAATGSANGTQVWNTQDGRLIGELSEIELPARDVAWSPDGTRIAATDSEASVHILDPESLQILLTLRTRGPAAGTLGYTPRVAFSRDGSKIVGNSPHGFITVWDAGRGYVNRHLQNDAEAARQAWANGQTEIAMELANRVVESESANVDALLWKSAMCSLLTDCHETNNDATSAAIAQSRREEFSNKASAIRIAMGASAVGTIPKPPKVEPILPVPPPEPAPIAPAVLAMTPAEAFASDKWMWTVPVKLPPGINTEVREYSPSLTADDLTLVFSSERSGGQGGFDLWMSERPSVEAPWPDPQNLGAIVNSEDRDFDPTFSADGLALIFKSDRNNTQPYLWESTRESRDAEWPAPVRIQGEIPVSAQFPYLTSDKLQLYYGGNLSEPTDPSKWSIYVSSRESVDARWTAPSNLGPAIDSADNCEWAPRVSRDGLLLFYNTGLRGEGRRLMMSRRNSPAESWSAPEYVEDIRNARCPNLMSDGRTLIYEQAADLWTVRRVPVW